ncbi:hypothetical protein T484DRAFT_1862308 [Baffinella frigidus]|nr:hypothetical protein T484DRAFT_1862308 [Cryptophyta sp. CCMP2293]
MSMTESDPAADPADKEPEDGGGSPRKKGAAVSAKDNTCECTTCGKAFTKPSNLEAYA